MTSSGLFLYKSFYTSTEQFLLAASQQALPDCDDLSKVQLIIIHLGNKDGRHGLVERSAIHIDGGPNGQHETDDASVNVVVLKEALEGDRQSGRAAAKKQGKDKYS